MKTKPLLISLFVLSMGLFLSRLMPHAANWGPALAIGVFAGFLARKSPLGFVLPALAWLATDLVLGFYDGMLFNYAALLGCSLTGMGLRVLHSFFPNLKQKAAFFAGFAGAGVAASTVFFLISNFGVWFFQAPQCQPFNLAGLSTCYIGGLLFYWPTLISTSAWMLMFAGVYQLVQSQAEQWLVEKA